MCPLILIFLQPYTQSISSVYYPCSSLSKWSIDYAYACGQGFGYLHFQFSSIRCHQGLSVFTALRSEIDIKCVDTDGPAHPDTAALRLVAEHVSAIEGLLPTDLSARYLMGPAVQDELSLFWLSHRRRSQMLLLLKFRLKAYALRKGMNDADSQHVWEHWG